MLLGGVKERKIARGEFKIFVAIFFHFATKFGGAGEFDWDFEFRLIAEKGESDFGADVVLPDQLREFLFVLRAGRGEFFAIDSGNEVARFQAGLFGAGLGIDFGDVESLEIGFVQLAGNVASDWIVFGCYLLLRARGRAASHIGGRCDFGCHCS